MDTDLAETEARLAPAVNTMRIIAAALIGGVLAFGLIAAFLSAQNDPPPADEAVEEAVDGDLDADDPILGYLGLGFAVLALAGYKPLGSAVAAGAGNDADEAELVGIYQTRLIVRLTLLEGITFICLFFQIAETWWPLWLAVGALVGAMLLEFPSVGKLRRFLKARRQLAALEPNEPL